MSRDSGRERLIIALRSTPQPMRIQLEEMKRDGARLMERPDFVWYSLLESAATLGNSRGHEGLIANSDNFDLVSFRSLESLSISDQRQRLDQVLRQARVRMPGLKAARLDRNFKIIETMGGLEAAKRGALSALGRPGKLAFMKQFHGIGDKYARDIWMNVYDPDFRECVALDSRVQSITRALGYSFKSYEEHEQFYIEIAHAADLNGWELDRLLYNFRDHYLAAVGDK